MSKKSILVKKHLGVGNRDGELYAVQGTDGKFYLVLESDTSYLDEEFDGMGSVGLVEISGLAFDSLIGKDEFQR